MNNTKQSYVIRKSNRGSKRKVDVENWKDFKNKRLRNSGESNISRNGKIIQNKNAPNEVIWKNVVSTERFKGLFCFVAEKRCMCLQSTCYA